MPNRILKESICVSASVDFLSCEAERFWYRLLVQCDDYGRMDARLDVLRARCFPLRLAHVQASDIKCWLEELAGNGSRHPLIQLYSNGGQPYLHVVNWDKHQQVRAKRSKYPDPQTSDIIGNQVQSNVPVIQSNPIQSNPNLPAAKQPASVGAVEVQDAWNATAKANGLSVCLKLSTRLPTLRARLKDAFWAENWRKALALIPSRPFLLGKVKDWKADFDWFIKPNSVTSIIEGKYSGGAIAVTQEPEVHETILTPEEYAESEARADIGHAEYEKNHKAWLERMARDRDERKKREQAGDVGRNVQPRPDGDVLSIGVPTRPDDARPIPFPNSR